MLTVFLFTYLFIQAAVQQDKFSKIWQLLPCSVYTDAYIYVLSSNRDIIKPFFF